MMNDHNVLMPSTFDQQPLQGLQLLLVEDDSDNRDFLTFVLEQYGATVIATASARDAYAVLLQAKPDAVISDIGMPETDGYSFIQQIRALPPEHGGAVPAIALTAYAAEADSRQALAAGFQVHLAKPIEPSSLIEAIVSLTHIDA